MTYKYHDESIIKALPKNTVFVFGSNLAGQHIDGAAKTALTHFGALKGVGRGWSGQSYAIPTINEHLQQMPLSQIQHYIDDFKIYTKNHPKIQYFITSLGCGIAGYKIEEIAPMFRGISRNVIFPQSFRAFVEKPLPKLTDTFLHCLFCDAVILATESDALIDALDISDNEKSLAKILVNTPMYPTDSNDRDRVFEIQDILHNLETKIPDFQQQTEKPMLFGGVVLALLELYHINEQDFADAWHAKRQITPPKPEHKSKKS
ncbi:hypothetical protein GFH30_04645 [Acinetobacter wanghuae]|uniref:Uncharacterized protein n=1 Tax=Acinetobacter wanghuae TaxID=2662362 RepID=A0A5Q0P2E6_9GAMM|nr:hypothetical protein [Acinetobacter wanghuae]MQW92106.1 hypothetical protein [Acinetobacter wanghuae]QGA10723.1 hypothetical protein GFH30_04645 [Acinetobacter wanghuae]